ncbi:MAG: hypothetical protein HY791_19030 [Deltaproteobacteria bacterium]|nr:hypothetical protein [Deltaproteobacteria bacterium]
MRAALALCFVTSVSCGSDPLPEAGPPFDFVRADTGDPISAAELADATDLYVDLLERTKFLRTASKFAHGYPDRPDRPGFATWWSGVRVHREGHKLTFLHSNDGADNNGLRTAPFLETACYAFKLFHDPQDEAFIRRMVRGFGSWISAMERTSAPNAPVLMTRAFYPENLTYEDHGLEITIDYSLNRPGLDNGATEYVHIPDNPSWGDIYVKNKRSKDDIGHMLLALAELETCKSELSAEAQAEIDEVMSLYEAWSRQVEDDGFKIKTYDKNLDLWIPTESLAIFVQTLDAECDAMLTLKLVGRGSSGGKRCGNGITDSDALFSELNDNNRHIFWSFHQASALWSVRRGELDQARALVEGMGTRMDDIFSKIENGDLPNFYNAPDFAAFIMRAGFLGVPLTSREIRFVHEQVRQADEGYFSETNLAALAAFDPEAPDGEKSFGLAGPGLDFRTLGLGLGVCATREVNPNTRTLFDCSRMALQ